MIKLLSNDGRLTKLVKDPNIFRCLTFADIERGRFICDACSSKFDTKFLLNLHRITQCKMLPYKCSVCKLRFPTRLRLVHHEKIHRLSNSIKSDVSYLTKKYAWKEESSDSDVNSYSCSKCNLKFEGRRSLERHERIHSDKRYYQCDRCHLGFFWKSNYNRHRKNPCMKKGYQCNRCHRLFSKKLHLVQHQNHHDKSRKSCKGSISYRSDPEDVGRYRPFPKPSTSDGASHPQLRLPKVKPNQNQDSSEENKNGDKSHEDYSSGETFQPSYVTSSLENRYRCETCGLGFKWKCDLSRHWRTHDKVKPFPCDQCELGFNWKSNLVRHQRRMHVGRMVFQCDACGRGFAKKYHLSRHRTSYCEKLSKKNNKDKTADGNDDCNCDGGKESNPVVIQLHATGDDEMASGMSKELQPEEPLPGSSKEGGPKIKIETPKTTQEVNIIYLHACYDEMKPDHSEECNPERRSNYSLSENHFLNEDSQSGNDAGVIEYCLQNTNGQIRQRHETSTSKHFKKANKEFVCSVCSRVFSRKSCHVQHERSHHKKLMKCEWCPRIFNRNSVLMTHRRVHTGEKPFQCEGCLCYFRQKSQLKQHRKIHMGVKPHVCDVCNRGFSRRSILVRHKMIHTGEKPFQCDVCHLCFNQKSILVQHLKIHTGTKPYKCKKCNYSFTQKWHYQRHMQRVHTSEKTFTIKCDACPSSFPRKRILIEHKKIHQQKKFVFRIYNTRLSRKCSQEKSKTITKKLFKQFDELEDLKGQQNIDKSDIVQIMKNTKEHSSDHNVLEKEKYVPKLDKCPPMKIYIHNNIFSSKTTEEPQEDVYVKTQEIQDLRNVDFIEIKKEKEAIFTDLSSENSKTQEEKTIFINGNRKTNTKDCTKENFETLVRKRKLKNLKNCSKIDIKKTDERIFKKANKTSTNLKKLNSDKSNRHVEIEKINNRKIIHVEEDRKLLKNLLINETDSNLNVRCDKEVKIEEDDKIFRRINLDIKHIQPENKEEKDTKVKQENSGHGKNADNNNDKYDQNNGNGSHNKKDDANCENDNEIESISKCKSKEKFTLLQSSKGSNSFFKRITHGGSLTESVKEVKNKSLHDEKDLPFYQLNDKYDELHCCKNVQQNEEKIVKEIHSKKEEIPSGTLSEKSEDHYNPDEIKTVLGPELNMRINNSNTSAKATTNETDKETKNYANDIPNFKKQTHSDQNFMKNEIQTVRKIPSSDKKSATDVNKAMRDLQSQSSSKIHKYLKLINKSIKETCANEDKETHRKSSRGGERNKSTAACGKNESRKKHGELALSKEELELQEYIVKSLSSLKIRDDIDEENEKDNKGVINECQNKIIMSKNNLSSEEEIKEVFNKENSHSTEIRQGNKETFRQAINEYQNEIIMAKKNLSSEEEIKAVSDNENPHSTEIRHNDEFMNQKIGEKKLDEAMHEDDRCLEQDKVDQMQIADQNAQLSKEIATINEDNDDKICAQKYDLEVGQYQVNQNSVSEDQSKPTNFNNQDKNSEDQGHSLKFSYERNLHEIQLAAKLKNDHGSTQEALNEKHQNNDSITPEKIPLHKELVKASCLENDAECDIEVVLLEEIPVVHEQIQLTSKKDCKPSNEILHVVEESHKQDAHSIIDDIFENVYMNGTSHCAEIVADQERVNSESHPSKNCGTTKEDLKIAEEGYDDESQSSIDELVENIYNKKFVGCEEPPINQEQIHSIHKEDFPSRNPGSLQEISPQENVVAQKNVEDLAGKTYKATVSYGAINTGQKPVQCQEINYTQNSVPDISISNSNVVIENHKFSRSVNIDQDSIQDSKINSTDKGFNQDKTNDGVSSSSISPDQDSVQNPFGIRNISETNDSEQINACDKEKSLDYNDSLYYTELNTHPSTSQYSEYYTKSKFCEEKDSFISKKDQSNQTFASFNEADAGLQLPSFEEICSNKRLNRDFSKSSQSFKNLISEENFLPYQNLESCEVDGNYSNLENTEISSDSNFTLYNNKLPNYQQYNPYGNAQSQTITSLGVPASDKDMFMGQNIPSYEEAFQKHSSPFNNTNQTNRVPYAEYNFNTQNSMPWSEVGLSSPADIYSGQDYFQYKDNSRFRKTYAQQDIFSNEVPDPMNHDGIYSSRHEDIRASPNFLPYGENDIGFLPYESMNPPYKEKTASSYDDIYSYNDRCEEIYNYSVRQEKVRTYSVHHEEIHTIQDLVRFEKNYDYPVPSKNIPLHTPVRYQERKAYQDPIYRGETFSAKDHIRLTANRDATRQNVQQIPQTSYRPIQPSLEDILDMNGQASKTQLRMNMHTPRDVMGQNMKFAQDPPRLDFKDYSNLNSQPPKDSPRLKMQHSPDLPQQILQDQSKLDSQIQKDTQGINVPMLPDVLKMKVQVLPSPLSLKAQPPQVPVRATMKTPQVQINLKQQIPKNTGKLIVQTSQDITNGSMKSPQRAIIQFPATTSQGNKQPPEAQATLNVPPSKGPQGLNMHSSQNVIRLNAPSSSWHMQTPKNPPMFKAPLAQESIRLVRPIPHYPASSSLGFAPNKQNPPHGISSSTVQNLNQSIRKRFQDQVWSKRMSLEYGQNKRIRLDTGCNDGLQKEIVFEKLFRCDLCEQKFTRKEDLIRHRFTAHEKIRIVKSCSINMLH
ncbi:zinc finger protein 845 [Caerostris darwini]|uniref:Zinc finger protein 845 n=1 Tax=Caerostris darwini TaxID=1538125 RepID=A0AAV4V1I7_9ARAC|nr:zinc finger protein 845 [Caerostris darwini]